MTVCKSKWVVQMPPSRRVREVCYAKAVPCTALSALDRQASFAMVSNLFRMLPTRTLSVLSSSASPESSCWPLATHETRTRSMQG